MTDIQLALSDDLSPAPTARVGVLLPLPLAGVYDYAVPAELTVGPGDIVRVPLGPRFVVGVVWGDGTGEVDAKKLKPLAERLDLPPMTEVQRRFIDWVAAYTLSSQGAVLRMALSIPEALERESAETFYRLAAPPPDVRQTPARDKVLALPKTRTWDSAAAMARAAGVGAGVVRGLIEAGAVVAVAETGAWTETPDAASGRVVLSPGQGAAADALRAAVRSASYSATVLEGVTGSGKTEVYFEAIAEALAAGKQCLVLLPEIALSAQWLDRFRRRFGTEPALWHSDVRRTQRRRVWRDIAEGRAQVVVGARSALFLPYPDLGLIVVDEEHDQSYKQEEGVVYHARDMAVVRASLGAFPVLLASATPALETVVNVERGRYRHLSLPERHGGAALPDIAAVDMRADPPPRGRWLAPALEAALVETLAKGEQALLFLNRRGYAPLTLCRACGHRMECPNCSAWLVEHRLAGRLMCHHCGFSTPPPDACPQCGTADSLVPCGPGVERLVEEVTVLFPQARLALMASDTIYGPDAAQAMVRDIQEHRIDLVIGTQIVAKGHHFPMLTLVGVVDADLGLEGGDLRAAERTWQLLSQVAGRAGRGALAGKVLLQTYQPDHPVLATLIDGDRDGFVEAELAARERAGVPPFGRLAALVISGKKEGEVVTAARELARSIPPADGVSVLGPAPAPLAVLRGLHRWRLLVKAPRDANLQGYIRRWTGGCRWPSSVRVKVDIDPYSFL